MLKNLQFILSSTLSVPIDEDILSPQKPVKLIIRVSFELASENKFKSRNKISLILYIICVKRANDKYYTV